MNIRWVALAAMLLTVAGCASTSKVMLGRARAPIDPSQVQIYSTPPAGSQEIAQLESSSAVGFGTQGQTDAAVARLKREAAALGANGVILMGVGSSGSPVGMSVGAGSYGSHVGGGVGIGIPTTRPATAGKGNAGQRPALPVSSSCISGRTAAARLRPAGPAATGPGRAGSC
ncbi:hypothetical protein AB4071_03620 [Stenotrophomonas sp. 2MCAF14_2]|uniref:hypothetical protein n=1 Tax=Stenotrophomonas sp. 2MCAF14_2 TaxID=3232983 RepID=UPI003F97059C